MKKPRILIAEDERIVVLDLQKRLLSLDYEIAGVATTSKECINAVLANKPDIILMDIILKGDKDGISTAAEIKERFDIPVVYLTAHTDDQTIQRAKITEPYGYIIKPFEMKDLQTTLEIALYRSQMEARLSESEIKYRTLVQTATDAVLILNTDGCITSVNPKSVQMFGYPEEQMVGASIKKIMPDVFINHLEHGVKRFLEVGKPITADVLEVTARKFSGENFPVEIAFSSWNTGQVLYFTLIVRDITKRKQTEDELKKAHGLLEQIVLERTAELQALINQSPLGIALFESDGKIAYGNNVWKNIWNESALQTQNESYNLFQDPVFVKNGYVPLVEQILIKGGSFTTGELYLAPEDYPELSNSEGLVVVFHFYTVQVAGEPTFRIVSLVENVTDSVKALDASREVAEQKGRMALIVEMLETERTRISRELHDGVGQILSAIKLNIEVFEKSGNQDMMPLKRAKDLLTGANCELRDIIYSLHPVYLDNGGLPAALQTLCSETMNSANLKISLQVDGLEKRVAPKLELATFRIIQEAINNAVKHSRADVIDIRVRKIGNLLDLYVRDNGQGFNAGSLQQTKETHGFGLVGIRERVETLNGSFHLESAPGKGVEFFINIPLTEKG
ncbi:MAG: PAS domain S-box protein [Ignavibacteriales bacterium]|nr:PAS domain S-box protein [Ignavibacteriales bacterium]